MRRTAALGASALVVLERLRFARRDAQLNGFGRDGADEVGGSEPLVVEDPVSEGDPGEDVLLVIGNDLGDLPHLLSVCPGYGMPAA